MYPHRIRLRGPWEFSCLSDTGWQPTSRVNLPDGWAFAYPKWTGSRLRGTRQFGIPRILDADESVWLVFRGWSEFQVTLNGRQLVGDPSEFDVTHALAPRNELIIEAQRPANAPDVSLEVRGPVILRETRYVPTRHGWAGRVVGEPRADLQIHLIAWGRCVNRLEVRASPGGEPFFVPRPDSLPEGRYNPELPEWRLELIENANRWWSEDVIAATGPLID